MVINLPDHAVHFFPSPACPSPEQAPADQGHHFQVSAQDHLNMSMSYNH